MATPTAQKPLAQSAVIAAITDRAMHQVSAPALDKEVKVQTDADIKSQLRVVPKVAKITDYQQQEEDAKLDEVNQKLDTAYINKALKKRQKPEQLVMEFVQTERREVDKIHAVLKAQNIMCKGSDGLDKKKPSRKK